jgi:hypothetical protein
MKPAVRVLATTTIALLLAVPCRVHGQRGAGGQVTQTPRQAAPIDLTGNWVSVVSEDWRFRMQIAQKGDWDIIPLNAEGKRIAEAWDPSRDEAAGDQCKAYGAAGIMRMPGRFRISWENDTTLKMESDAGMQTRRLLLGDSPPPGSEPTWQGYSIAQWEFAGGQPPRGGGQARGGQLKVVTTRMRPGYYFKHGVPYSGNAVLTEYFNRITEPDGNSYLMVTTMADDPQYLNQQFVRTLMFKLEPDGSRWSPKPCTAR